MKDDNNTTVNNEDSNPISRRSFLKYTAVGMASVAGAGLLAACGSGGAQPPQAVTEVASESAAPPPVPEAAPEAAPAEPGGPPPATYVIESDWLGKEPDIAESAIAETLDFDVVVVGAGLAGVCAARSAAEQGAKVAVIEKSAQANCRSGEIAVLGGKLNEYFGRAPIDTDLVVDRFMRECTYRIKRPIISKWAEQAHEAFDWYIDAKPDLYIAKSTREDIPDEHKDVFLVPLSWPLPELYDYNKEEFPTFPYSVEFKPSQAVVSEANVAKCENDLGVQVFYGSFAEKLEKSGGRITGAVVRDAEKGSYFRLNAKNGVILATGDNGGNPAIMAHYTPAVITHNIPGIPIGFDAEGNVINTGDGLKMGAWAGAKVQENHAPMIHHMGSMGGGLGITPYLLLNKHGNRFMNECVPGQQVQNQIELQPGFVVYQIFDDNWREQLQYMPINHGACCYYDNNVPANNAFDRQYASDAAFQEGVDSGGVKTADTLEGLLEQLDIDKTAALAAIERYNTLAKAGKDEDFNKPAQRMFALEKGPFYACEFGFAAMLVNCGGLESDEDCHVFDMSGERIPGLYVAGNVQGNRYAVEYPICMKGISHSMCTFYGYVAGKNAAAGI